MGSKDLKYHTEIEECWNEYGSVRTIINCIPLQLIYISVDKNKLHYFLFLFFYSSLDFKIIKRMKSRYNSWHSLTKHSIFWSISGCFIFFHIKALFSSDLSVKLLSKYFQVANSVWLEKLLKTKQQNKPSKRDVLV